MDPRARLDLCRTSGSPQCDTDAQARCLWGVVRTGATVGPAGLGTCTSTVAPVCGRGEGRGSPRPPCLDRVACTSASSHFDCTHAPLTAARTGGGSAAGTLRRALAPPMRARGCAPRLASPGGSLLTAPPRRALGWLCEQHQRCLRHNSTSPMPVGRVRPRPNFCCSCLSVERGCGRPAVRACVRMHTEAKRVALHSDSTQQVAQPAAGDVLFVRFDPVIHPRVCVNA